MIVDKVMMLKVLVCGCKSMNKKENSMEGREEIRKEEKSTKKHRS